MRALIIGTGSIGRRHIANLRELEPRCTFAFVRDGARECDLSRELGAAVYSSIPSALRDTHDISVVATPSNLHMEPLTTLLDARVPTLIEKPVVITRPDHEALMQRSPGDLPPTQVGCLLRFLPGVEVLADWIAQGRLGRIVRARLECGQYLPDWRPASDYRESYSASPARGGGVIFDLVHEIDLACMLFGNLKLQHVMAGRRSNLEIDSEDHALLHLTARDGMPIAIELDYVSRKPVREVNVVGDEATAKLDFLGRSLTLTGPEGPMEQLREGLAFDIAYKAELRDLIDAGRESRTTRLPLHEGLKAADIAIAAHERLAA